MPRSFLQSDAHDFVTNNINTVIIGCLRVNIARLCQKM